MTTKKTRELDVRHERNVQPHLGNGAEQRVSKWC